MMYVCIHYACCIESKRDIEARVALYRSTDSDANTDYRSIVWIILLGWEKENKVVICKKSFTNFLVNLYGVISSILNSFY